MALQMNINHTIAEVQTIGQQSPYSLIVFNEDGTQTTIYYYIYSLYEFIAYCPFTNISPPITFPFQPVSFPQDLIMGAMTLLFLTDYPQSQYKIGVDLTFVSGHIVSDEELSYRVSVLTEVGQLEPTQFLFPVLTDGNAGVMEFDVSLVVYLIKCPQPSLSNNNDLKEYTTFIICMYRSTRSRRTPFLVFPFQEYFYGEALKNGLLSRNSEDLIGILGVQPSLNKSDTYPFSLGTFTSQNDVNNVNDLLSKGHS